MNSDIIQITDGKETIEVTERVFDVIYADRGWKRAVVKLSAKEAPTKTKGK